MYYYEDFGNGFGNSYGYGNDYSYGVSGIDYSSLEALIGGIIAIYMIVLVVGLIFALVKYILKGIGMYTIAKREERDYPWLAFVPFARTYLQGELSGNVTLKKRQIKNPGIWLIVMPFIAGAGALILYVLYSVIGLSLIFSTWYYGIGAGTVTGIVILSVISILLMLVYNAAYKVLQVLVNKQIYAKFTSKNMAVVHAVLGIFIPLYEAICMFIMRNKEYNPGMEPMNGQPFRTSVPPTAPGQPGAATSPTAPGQPGAAVPLTAPGRTLTPVSPATPGRTLSSVPPAAPEQPASPTAPVSEPELGPKTEPVKAPESTRPAGPIAGDGFVMSDELPKKVDDPQIKPLHETENRPYSYGMPPQDAPAKEEQFEEAEKKDAE